MRPPRVRGARRTAGGFSVAIAAVLVSALATTADAAEGLRVASVDTSGSPTVAVYVKPPPALAGVSIPPEAFRVFQGGFARAVEVSRLRGEDLEVVLVVDASAATSGAPLQSAKGGAAELLLRMPAGARFAVIGCADASAVVAPLTTDVASAMAGVSKLQARGSGALGDAISSALSQFSPRTSTRRAVVVLEGPGTPVFGASLARLSATLSERGVAVYAVRPATREDRQDDLSRLASATAGRVVSVPVPYDPNSVAAAHTDVAADLLNEYRLGFPVRSSGRTEVRVRLEHRGVVAETTQVIDVPPVSSTPGASGGPQDPAAATPDDAAAARPAGESPRRVPWGLVARAAAGVALVLALVLHWPTRRRHSRPTRA